MFYPQITQIFADKEMNNMSGDNNGLGIDSMEAMKQTIDGKDQETHQIIGSAMEVHKQLGYGFLETVYQDALEREFIERGIPAKREFPLEISYKDAVLKSKYFTDFVCFNGVIVELKALTTIGNNEIAQVINYLKASGIERGLLLNFGTKSLQYRRLVLSRQKVEYE